jgi:hypothetical protein
MLYRLADGESDHNSWRNVRILEGNAEVSDVE